MDIVYRAAVVYFFLMGVVGGAVGMATAVALHVQHTGAFLSGCRILGT